MSMLFTNILISHGRGSTGSNPARLEGGYVKYYATYSNLMQMGGLYQFDQGSSMTAHGVSIQDHLRWRSPWGLIPLLKKKILTR